MKRVGKWLAVVSLPFAALFMRKGTREPQARPLLHFTPREGWINDPNGLVFDGKLYHLFAQHNPYSTNPGPMHWLHADSPDLINWTQQPIALAPGELGAAYSGSAVIDRENAAGFGKGAMLLFYTAHGDSEQQCLAYSNDYSSFTQYAGNPIIANTQLRDFRDPKVIENLNGGWTMLVAAGKEIIFYASTDLKGWTESGRFAGKTNGVYECPDLFELGTKDGKRKWVLLYSENTPLHKGRKRSCYIVGSFDGGSFSAESAPLPFDFGTDNYASVTFSNTGGEVIAIGWASNWAYSSSIPCGDGWRGIMTLPRRLSLSGKEGEYRLAAEPILPKAQGWESLRASRELSGGCFVLKAEQLTSLTLENAHGECYRVYIDEKKRLVADRSGASSIFSSLFPLFSKSVSEPLGGGATDITLVYDNGVLELFANGGTIAITQLIFPAYPLERITVNCGTALFLDCGAPTVSAP
jgi:fructan beta-fructosidase